MTISSVPSIQFTAAGVVIPAETDVLAGVIADMDAAFGGGLNPALETPQGQIASSTAAIIADKNAQILLLSNQVDPQYADGRWQDAIARIYFLTRDPATSTAVAVQVTGIPGTVIPANTFAQDTSGNTYAATGDITIDSTGTTAGEFQNVLTGPIPCPAGTLTQVYQAIPGWDAITNATDGALGSLVESRADFEFRRKNSVALNAHGSAPSIYGAVFEVANVLDAYVIDNPLGTVVNTGPTNYPMAANSVYVAVVGGANQDIGNAIWGKKDLGCNYNGNTSVTVVDPSGYSYPQPSYTVKFNRPTALPILFAVQIANNSTLPANIIALVKQAIIDQFSGVTVDATLPAATQAYLENNLPVGERIGASIFASRYYGIVSTLAANISVISILIGTSTATLNTVSVGIDQSPSISAGNISVTLV